MIIEISDSSESTDSELDSDRTLDKFLITIQSSQSTLNPTAQVVPLRFYSAFTLDLIIWGREGGVSGSMSESENLEDILSSMKEDRLFTLPTFPLSPPLIYLFTCSLQLATLNTTAKAVLSFFPHSLWEVWSLVKRGGGRGGAPTLCWTHLEKDAFIIFVII